MGLFSTFEAVEILKRDKQIASLAAEIEALRNLLKRLDPFLDSIVCYASTIGEHEANRVVVDIRAALQPKEDAA